MKFVEGEKRYWNMLLTLPEGALLPFHEQLMNVDEGVVVPGSATTDAVVMYTEPPLCSYIKENKQRNTEVEQQNKCQKIFPWKKMKRRKMFLNRQYGCDIEREKKISYHSCCIVFEMNSYEFTRTTINEHSTTILLVIS